MLAWPGALNMLSIIVQGMGLQYISASVSQMISGEHEVCRMQYACKASCPGLSSHTGDKLEVQSAAIMAYEITVRGDVQAHASSSLQLFQSSFSSAA